MCGCEGCAVVECLVCSFGGVQRLVARCGWGARCGVMRGARGGPHAWFTVSFLCCSKQWSGLLLGVEWPRPSNCARRLARGLCVVGEMLFVLTRCFLQIGDGTSGTDRLTPVAVVGLGSGVANVALGGVRLLVQRGCWCFWGGVVGVRLRGLGCFVECFVCSWGGRSGWLRVLVGLRCGMMRGARGGPHAWYTDAFLCCSKQWSGILLGVEWPRPSNCAR